MTCLVRITNINEHENNAAPAYSNYLYVFVFTYIHSRYGKYFLNFQPTTGILYSVLRRMSASLFYSRIVELFTEVRKRDKERESKIVSRCFYSQYTTHTYYIA